MTDNESPSRKMCWHCFAWIDLTTWRATKASPLVGSQEEPNVAEAKYMDSSKFVPMVAKAELDKRIAVSKFILSLLGGGDVQGMGLGIRDLHALRCVRLVELICLEGVKGLD